MTAATDAPMTAIDRAKQRQAARDASGEVYIEGSIYEGFAACLVRSGKTVAHVIKYDDAVAIAAALACAPAGEGEAEIRNRIINTPETADFMAGVPIEAAHQRERWDAKHDAGKGPLDWFWLIGYLSQKAADAAMRGDDEKAKHHTISTAAALANWHAALTGADTAMRPGISASVQAAVEPQPIRCPDAETTQRFNAGDLVSHNGGLIEEHSKRQITAVLGYDRDGGVQYRLALVGGGDRGMAYDCELDAWPGDDAPLPIPSPRAGLYDGKGK